MDKTEEIFSSVIKPRNGLIAFFLSLLLPGLGQVYNGQLKKGAIFFGLLLIFPLMFGITRGMTFFYGLCSLVVIEIFLRIYIVFDAVKNAKKQKKYILKPYNRWYYHLMIAMGMLTILMIYDINTVLGIKTFNIPSTSNNPTFQVGDWLLADMRAYSKNNPEYGDIIVYSGPDEEMYTFRVVGLPNDNLGLVENIVSINGKTSKSTFIKKTKNNDVSVLEFEEELPNGHKHIIYKFQKPNDSTTSNIKDIIVPSNSYYVLGDNRDSAADSRYEGAINKDRIKGKIVFSYWGHSLDRINIDFTDK